MDRDKGDKAHRRRPGEAVPGNDKEVERAVAVTGGQESRNKAYGVMFCFLITAHLGEDGLGRRKSAEDRNPQGLEAVVTCLSQEN